MENIKDNLQNQEFINPNQQRKLLDRALQYGAIDDLRKLVDEGMNINQTDFEGRTALQLMAFKGNKVAVEMLITRGADVNCIFMYQGRIPMSALDAAREAGKTEIEDVLLAHGAKTGAELLG